MTIKAALPLSALLSVALHAAAQITVPAELARAKTVLLAPAGDTQPQRDGTTLGNWLYTGVYQCLTMSPYKPVASAAEADLLMELSIASQGSDTYIHLAIIDPKTHALLWGLNQYFEVSERQSIFEKNVQKACPKLIGNLTALSTGKLPQNN